MGTVDPREGTSYMGGNLEDVELSKENASIEACKHVEDSLSEKGLIGLGTGSTTKKFIDKCHSVLRKHLIASSSYDTLLYIKQYGLTALDSLTLGQLDVYIDSADEVSGKLDMIKGRGGAFLREKTLASIARRRIYIVDFTKYTGKKYLYIKPIPLEVTPFALSYVLGKLSNSDAFKPEIRMGGGKDGPIMTDNGNYIVDLILLKPVTDPKTTHYQLKSIHGVVETGIFPAEELVDIVIVGYPEKTLVFRRD
ncbi:MAG: ribose 5-phosphate isomerase A [Desulfurococcaceae archaeon]